MPFLFLSAFTKNIRAETCAFGPLMVYFNMYNDMLRDAAEK